MQIQLFFSSLKNLSTNENSENKIRHLMQMKCPLKLYTKLLDSFFKKIVK